MPGPRVERCLKREVISRCYNGLVRGMFRVGFSDAHCGLMAITREAARELVPLVEDNGWFFDFELLLQNFLSLKDLIDLLFVIFLT